MSASAEGPLGAAAGQAGLGEQPSRLQVTSMQGAGQVALGTEGAEWTSCRTVA